MQRWPPPGVAESAEAPPPSTGSSSRGTNLLDKMKPKTSDLSIEIGIGKKKAEFGFKKLGSSSPSSPKHGRQRGATAFSVSKQKKVSSSRSIGAQWEVVQAQAERDELKKNKKDSKVKKLKKDKKTKINKAVSQRRATASAGYGRGGDVNRVANRWERMGEEEERKEQERKDKIEADRVAQQKAREEAEKRRKKEEEAARKEEEKRRKEAMKEEERRKKEAEKEAERVRVQALFDMGFTDRTKNAKLLRQNGNDVPRVAQILRQKKAELEKKEAEKEEERQRKEAEKEADRQRMQRLFDMGYTNKTQNSKLLAKHENDVNRVAEVLRLKKLEQEKREAEKEEDRRRREAEKEEDRRRREAEKEEDRRRREEQEEQRRQNQATLAAMGFVNKAQNAKLLAKHSGDVNQVATILRKQEEDRKRREEEKEEEKKRKEEEKQRKEAEREEEKKHREEEKLKKKLLKDTKANKENSGGLLFKRSLSDVMKDQATSHPDLDIPHFVDVTVNYLENHPTANKFEGFFRKTGFVSEQTELHDLFDAGGDVVYDDSKSSTIAYTAANLLKIFLRELPEPIMMFEHFDRWMNASKLVDDSPDEFIEEAKRILSDLPRVNYAILARLFPYWQFVCSDVNKENRMGPNALAIVVGPNLLYSSNPLDLASISTVNILTKALIERAHGVFGTKEHVISPERFASGDSKTVDIGALRKAALEGASSPNSVLESIKSSSDAPGLSAASATTTTAAGAAAVGSVAGDEGEHGGATIPESSNGNGRGNGRGQRGVRGSRLPRTRGGGRGLRGGRGRGRGGDRGRAAQSSRGRGGRGTGAYPSTTGASPANNASTADVSGPRVGTSPAVDGAALPVAMSLPPAGHATVSIATPEEMPPLSTSMPSSNHQSVAVVDISPTSPPISPPTSPIMSPKSAHKTKKTHSGIRSKLSRREKREKGKMKLRKRGATAGGGSDEAFPGLRHHPTVRGDVQLVGVNHSVHLTPNSGDNTIRAALLGVSTPKVNGHGGSPSATTQSSTSPALAITHEAPCVSSPPPHGGDVKTSSGPSSVHASSPPPVPAVVGRPGVGSASTTTSRARGRRVASARGMRGRGGGGRGGGRGRGRGRGRGMRGARGGSGSARGMRGGGAGRRGGRGRARGM